MSAPNVSLYALTIMAQPSFEEEHPDINGFQRVHRMSKYSEPILSCSLLTNRSLSSLHALSLWVVYPGNGGQRFELGLSME